MNQRINDVRMHNQAQFCLEGFLFCNNISKPIYMNLLAWREFLELQWLSAYGSRPMKILDRVKNENCLKLSKMALHTVHQLGYLIRPKYIYQYFKRNV